ncbi:MAG: endonuclease/exonuclease/phosphatase family protein, partial [Bacteroidales bacterium]|nr:endonuclease/exonuclease/phosphatase family protein [Bacteroidales bacterium]
SNILRERVLETISATDADIVCLQEAYWANKPADFPTLDVLSKNLKAKSVQKVRLNNFNYGTGGLAVVTRYKVINQYSHPFDSTANGFMYVDILMNEDTVRLYNCHLQSIMISNSDVDMSNGFNRENKDKAMNLYSKFSEASAHRAVQVDTLVATLDTCPYPVLLCGDFNDVPLSYACFQVLASGERLHDTFMERGEGSGRTFSVMGVDFRIDYIMHSNLFKCLRHKVLEFNIANDHYPVVAEFMW